MKKHHFKIAQSLALISNMALAIFFGLIVLFVLWVIKRSAATFVFLVGFSILALICSILNIIFAKKLVNLDFNAAPLKKLAKQTIQTSYIVVCPLIFAVYCHRFRALLWENYVQSKTKNITKEYELAKINLKILDELKADGYISWYKYAKQKDVYQASITKLEARKQQRKE